MNDKLVPVDDPFESTWSGMIYTTPGVETKRKALETGAMILRVAEIEDELERRGTDPLVRELTDLKRKIKETMIEEGVGEVYEETSGYEAVLQQRTSESWDVAALKALLSPAQRKRYIIIEERADVQAVADGVKIGDLSRAKLERGGAVTRVPGPRALYVRRRREDGDA